MYEISVRLAGRLLKSAMQAVIFAEQKSDVFHLSICLGSISDREERPMK